MPSPFAPSSPQPGSGRVHLTLLPPSTPSFQTLEFTYPLKLIPSNSHTLPPIEPSGTEPVPPQETPSHGRTVPPIRPTAVPLLFLLTYGGGLLPVDRINLSITLDASARLTIATQGSTKIYKSPPTSAPSSTPTEADNPSATSAQTIHCVLRPHSALCYFPHSIQPFDSSRYSQVQTFNLYEGASLGLLDWISEGRKARGESWGFDAWRGRNEVWIVKSDTEDGKEHKKLLLRDNVILEGGRIETRMDGLGVLGTIILAGPLFQSLAEFFTHEFASLPRIGGRNWDTGLATPPLTPREQWRVGRQNKEKSDGIMWTAASVRDERAVVVKFGAKDVQGAREWLGAMLREEGSVAKEFGEGALMCVG